MNNSAEQPSQPGSIVDYTNNAKRRFEAHFAVATSGIVSAEKRISQLYDQGLQLVIDSDRYDYFDPSDPEVVAIEADIRRVDDMIALEQRSIAQARQLAQRSLDSWLTFREG